MGLLEISNDNLFRDHFEQLSINTIQTPSLLFFLGTSKFVLFFVINIFIVYTFYIAIGQVHKENLEHKFEVEANKNKTERVEIEIGTLHVRYLD